LHIYSTVRGSLFCDWQQSGLKNNVAKLYFLYITYFCELS